VTDDFVTSTRVIAQGYRLVFDPEAVAFEPVAQSSEVEFGRKVRVMTRGLRGVIVMRELLNPFRFGFYAVQLFSHKVLRRLMFVPLMVVFAANLFLWGDGLFYKLAMLAQLLLVGRWVVLQAGHARATPFLRVRLAGAVPARAQNRTGEGHRDSILFLRGLLRGLDRNVECDSRTTHHKLDAAKAGSTLTGHTC